MAQEYKGKCKCLVCAKRASWVAIDGSDHNRYYACHAHKEKLEGKHNPSKLDGSYFTEADYQAWMQLTSR